MTYQARIDADPVGAAVPVAARSGGTPIRFAVWVMHLVLPLLGVWLLIAQPEIDIVWDHHGPHFWLVLTVAGINVGLGARISEAARQRADARLFLVSLAFVTSAAFLFLHALATPGVLLDGPNGGFLVAIPVGLFLAAVFAAVSSLDFTPRSSALVMRYQAVLRLGLAALVVGWAVLSLLRFPPLRVPPDHAEGQSLALGIAGVLLYLVAAVRYYAAYRRRPSVMLLSVLTAFALLAEAMVALVLAPNWHLSWWSWHLLMAVAFGFVAYSAYVQYQREGAAGGLFTAIGLDQTVRSVRAEYTTALESLVSVLRRLEQSGGTEQDRELITAGLARKFHLTEGQSEVLGRAAEALAHERDMIRRLAALVAVGEDTQIALGETQLLRRAVAHIAEGLGDDVLRLGLYTDGRLEFPPELSTGQVTGVDKGGASPGDAPTPAPLGDRARLLVLPLTVKGLPAGVVEVRRRRGDFAERDRSLLSSLASQLSIAVENARLYSQLDVLFRQYMSPDVANALLADPEQAALGGAEVEVTALFADLRGFTAFSERSSPEEIVIMLNRYFAVATPCVLDNDGTVVQFVGDAMMALFNAPARQPDHPHLAARAALAMQRSIDEIVDANPQWPRFRIGINTGPALVGNIGSAELRSFNAMGDAVNVAARLESIAQPGQVVIGAATYAAIAEQANVEPLGELEVKGKRERVTAFVLTDLREQHQPGPNQAGQLHGGG